MSSSESQTQTSILTQSLQKSENNYQNDQKTVKKKRKKMIKIQEGYDQQKIQTPKKRQRAVFKSNKSTKQQIKNPKLVLKNKGYQINCCEHASIYKKLLYSFILTAICMTIFVEPPKINYPLAQIQEGAHESVFQIVTDRKTRFIRFNLEIAQDVGSFIPISSTKSAKVRATVNYTLGYKFEHKKNEIRQRFNQHTQVQMSDLKIISYQIFDIVLQSQQDGFFNKWQFLDYQNLRKYINDKHIKQMQKQSLIQITDYKKKMYQSKAKFMLTQILQKYQSWFDWLLRRLDRYIDVGLQPYIHNYQIVTSQESE